jgi:hypothetical protein
VKVRPGKAKAAKAARPGKQALAGGEDSD